MKRKKAVKKVRAYLHAVAVANGVNPDVEVSIVEWMPERVTDEGEVVSSTKIIGVRFAEIDFWVTDPVRGAPFGAGASYMQSDVPWGIAACAAAERLTIALIEGWDEAEIEDEKARLTAALGFEDDLVPVVGVAVTPGSESEHG